MNLPRLLLVHDKIGNYCVPKLDPNLHMLSHNLGKLPDSSSTSTGVTPNTIGNDVRCTLNLQWGDETLQLFAPDPLMSEHYLLKPNFWKDVCHELPVQKPEAMRHSRCLAHTRNCIDNPTYWMLEEGTDAAA